MENYATRLGATRNAYPFARWAESGLEQYTEKACASFVAVFDELVETLVKLGEVAPETKELAAFQKAVEALNDFNETDGSLIETGEREDLCNLCNVVARAAGLEPSKYGGGEGPASEWRDW